MRRFFLLLMVALTAFALISSTGCKKRTLKDTPEDGQPTPTPGPPPAVQDLR